MLDTLAEQSWAESSTVWNSDFCKELAQECQRLSLQGQLKKAAIGSGSQKNVLKQIRGDFTLWLDPQGSNEIQARFLSAIQQIQNVLNQSFYLGLNTFETHFAHYPPGAGYDKHIDNHRGSSARKITFILYLNENWQHGDGGELSLYAPTKAEESETPRIALLPPRLGNFILFRSELFPHQVEKSMKPRLSVTGWFRNDAL